MKLEHLRVMQAVVEAGSFAQAAQDILFISQPAVSQAIRRLEESLGFNLFDRESYRPTLTEPGAAFYARAQTLLAESQSLERYAGILASGVESSLSIVFEPQALQARMLRVFREQTRCFAQSRFVFLDEQVGGAVVKLMDGEADLALGQWFPKAYADLPLEHVPLFSFTMCPVIATDTSADSLSDAVQIVMRTHERYLPAGGFYLEAGVRQWFVSDHATKQLLIEAGLGFGMLPLDAVQTGLAQGQLRLFRELPNYIEPEVEVHLFRRKDHPHGPVAQTLWQALSPSRQV